MKIVLFSQFYKPETIAPAFRAADNAKLWCGEGHDVTVFTGYPNYPQGKIFDGYMPKLLSEEKDGKVRVLRSKLIAKPNTSLLNRIENALSFFLFALTNILFRQRKLKKDYDVVIGTSGTIFAAMAGCFFAKLHQIPFVFEIRDITYKQLIATGSSETSIKVKTMKKIELYLCKQAKKVVVVTNGFKYVLSSDGIPEDKIEVITNGVDINLSETPQESKNNRFILSYFGTLGISQNIADTLPYAQAISQLISDFSYLIIGEGAQKEQMIQICKRPEYSFVTMLPGMDMETLEEYYSKTQLSIVTLKKTTDFGYTIPSKLFQIMGRGKAVLFIGPEGEAAEIIRKYNAGIVLTKSFEEDLIALRSFFSDSDWEAKLNKMMNNGAQAARENFSRMELARKYLAILKQCIKVEMESNPR